MSEKPDPKRIYVAAHNTPLPPGQSVHPWADFICDGIADEVEIQAAIEEAAPQPPILLKGTFLIDNSIKADVELEGEE